MLWPNGTTSRPSVSSAFGPRPNLGAFSFHYGSDLVGYTTVRSAGAGKVTFAGWMNAAAGNTVVIDLGGGVSEIHMHLASFAVSRGDWVNPAHALGRMGSTGNASGNCDHFEIRIKGTSVDPMAYTAARINGTPSGSGGGAVHEEDDMFTDQDREDLRGLKAAVFGPENVGATELKWVNQDGARVGEYGLLDIEIRTQELAAQAAAKPAITADQVKAIADAVVKAAGKLTVTLDYAAIAKAVNDDVAQRMVR